MASDSDPEISEFAKESISKLSKQSEELYAKLKILLIPKDENDDKNIVCEIRGAVGGGGGQLARDEPGGIDALIAVVAPQHRSSRRRAGRQKPAHGLHPQAGHQNQPPGVHHAGEQVGQDHHQQKRRQLFFPKLVHKLPPPLGRLWLHNILLVPYPK